jgi:hypothetical protein
MDIANLRKDLAAGSFEFSRHAFHRSVERNISADEIMQAGAVVEIIEDYPHDKYLPSCLLLGFTQGGRPLHLQVCYSEAGHIKIITLYEPDPGQWEEYRRRRTS